MRCGHITPPHDSTSDYIPKSCRPLFALVLMHELKVASTNNIWGMVRLQLVSKLTLRPPPRGGKRRRFNVSADVNKRLRRWLQGDITALWEDALEGSVICLR